MALLALWWFGLWLQTVSGFPVTTIGSWPDCWNWKILGRPDLSAQVRFWVKLRHELPNNFVYEKCREWTQIYAGYPYDLFRHTVWSLQIFEVRLQSWTYSGQTGYTGAWSGFWATRWVKLAVVRIQNLEVTHITCFDIWFGRYRFLKSGYKAGQILGRLGIQVLSQVFGPQDGWNLLWSKYKILR
jgi:hypothetical protein